MKQDLIPPSASKVHIPLFLLIHILPLYHSVSYSYTQQTQHLPSPCAQAGGRISEDIGYDIELNGSDVLPNGSSLVVVLNSVPIIHEPFKPTSIYLSPLYVLEKGSSSDITLPSTKCYFSIYFS